MKSLIEPITDQKPVYILKNGTIHRNLKNCYRETPHKKDFILKPMLILTYEEYLCLAQLPALLEKKLKEL